ncbi:MAG: hypothetical protein HY709_06220 [Candidatus Latescibacteria bacterium]|nr:hypothetical protein [Candidatus Latescibacterota bacterium]
MRIVTLGIIAIVTLCMLIGCNKGGGNSEGSQGSGITIRFINHYWGIVAGEREPRVIIAVCGHDFFLEPEEDRVAQCIPRGGEQVVLVRVEFPRFESLYGRYSTIVKTVTVSDGDIVTLTNEGTLEISR